MTRKAWISTTGTGWEVETYDTEAAECALKSEVIFDWRELVAHITAFFGRSPGDTGEKVGAHGHEHRRATDGPWLESVFHHRAGDPTLHIHRRMGDNLYHAHRRRNDPR